MKLPRKLFINLANVIQTQTEINPIIQPSSNTNLDHITEIINNDELNNELQRILNRTSNKEGKEDISSIIAELVSTLDDNNQLDNERLSIIRINANDQNN